MKTFKRILQVLALLTVLAAMFVGCEFLRGRSATQAEWTKKFPAKRRSPAAVRGLCNNMIKFRNQTVPAFVPMSAWDDEVCAANVIGAVNFLLGQEVLTMSTAWEFSRVNADKIRLVFDRRSAPYEDFEVLEENGKKRIREKPGEDAQGKKHDRAFYLSSKLKMDRSNGKATSDRLYIIGYHYQRTQSDHKILAAGADWNSHLMLILGRNGSWWGYHLLHEKDKPAANPFRIDDIGEQMPELFDLVYIWEVLGTEMPTNGEPLVLLQNSPPYEEVWWTSPRLGNGRIEHVVDTARVQWLFDGMEQFPRVVDVSQPYVELEARDSQDGWHGQYLGLYNGVGIRRHGGNSVRGPYGLEFQCVELINRYYVERLGHKNLTKSGDALEYFRSARGKDIVRFPAGSPEAPRADDILVFRHPADESHPGHVALVRRVTVDDVCVVQQNMKSWSGCLSLEQRDGGWYVGQVEGLTNVGWVRKETGR